LKNEGPHSTPLHPTPSLVAEVYFCIITCPPDTLDILFSAGAFCAGEGFFFRGEGRGGEKPAFPSEKH